MEFYHVVPSRPKYLKFTTPPPSKKKTIYNNNTNKNKNKAKLLRPLDPRAALGPTEPFIRFAVNPKLKSLSPKAYTQNPKP